MGLSSKRFAIEVQDSRWSTAKKFYSGAEGEFACRERSLLESVPHPICVRLLDLVRIASAVYFIDRIVKRDRRHGPNAWPRNISLIVEVSEPSFWSSYSIKQKLEEALDFVSGDHWAFRFASGSSSEESVSWQRPLSPEFYPANPRICLYSGGLDSAAGVSHLLSEGDGPPIIAVIVRHRSDLGEIAGQQLFSLERRFDREVHPIVVPFEMSSPSKLRVSEETSQRTRAFLFIAVGTAIADSFKSSNLEMFESGIGAINAPLLMSMEGSQATRGSHPNFLRLMSDLVSLILERPFQINLPFEGITKGELVESLSPADLQQIANSTCSCPSFPVRVKDAGKQQSCGYCAACLFRRVAMSSANIKESSSDYQYDLLDPTVVVPQNKLRYLIAYLNQIDCFRTTQQGALPAYLEKHLFQTKLLIHGQSKEAFVELYRRYRNEWINFVQRAEKNGCKWAQLIDLSQTAA